MKIKEHRRSTVYLIGGLSLWKMFKILFFYSAAGFIILSMFVVYLKCRLEKEYTDKMNDEVDKALSNYYLNNKTFEGEMEEK